MLIVAMYYTRVKIVERIGWYIFPDFCQCDLSDGMRVGHS